MPPRVPSSSFHLTHLTYFFVHQSIGSLFVSSPLPESSLVLSCEHFFFLLCIFCFCSVCLLFFLFPSVCTELHITFYFIYSNLILCSPLPSPFLSLFMHNFLHNQSKARYGPSVCRVLQHNLQNNSNAMDQGHSYKSLPHVSRRQPLHTCSFRVSQD